MNEDKSQASSAAAPRSLAQLGAALREAREAKGLSLDNIAAATCIRKNFLVDIESGTFERFKALVYARGFVRSYTETLEAPELWNEYSAALTAETFEPAAAKPVYPAGTGACVSTLPPSSMRAAAGAGAAVPTRGFRSSTTRRNCVIALVLLTLAGLGALAYNWDRLRAEITRIQSEQAYNEMKAREAEQARLAEKKKAEEEEIRLEREKMREQAAQAAAGSDDQAAAPVTVTEPPAEPVKAPEAAAAAKTALTVRATGKCWLRIRSGRRTVLETTVSEGWEQTFALDAPLDVVFGLGQNVSVSTNGKDFTSPGKGRQHLEYQTDGAAQQKR